MGCGASAQTRYVVSDEKVDELTKLVQKQSEQIASLVKTQHQLATQLALIGEPGKQPSRQVSPSQAGDAPVGDGVAALTSISLAPSVVPLVPAIQNYAWGKPWNTSLVARLCEGSGRELDRDKPYAELWLGTHPNGPAEAVLEGAAGAPPVVANLKELIADNAAYWMGKDAAKGNLPYLLKVLSVGQALSIQAHPDKKLAKRLHERYPDRYKDGNHKPEICLPLGEFEALVAFRPFDDIQRFVQDVKELHEILGDKVQFSLKDMYARLMRSDPKIVAHQVDAMVHRLSRREEADLTPEEKLILRLNKDYPGDVGIFSVYFLNYVRIDASSKDCFIFCAADEPHAYLSGDCVECMSLSDNVVRAGLTPKFKDVETLLDMMTYRDDRLDSLVSKGKRVSESIIQYNPPVEDFMVYEIESGGANTSLELRHASICVCVIGSFEIDFTHSMFSQVVQIQQGQCFFGRAGVFLSVLRSDEGSRLFIATY